MMYAPSFNARSLSVFTPQRLGVVRIEDRLQHRNRALPLLGLCGYGAASESTRILGFPPPPSRRRVFASRNSFFRAATEACNVATSSPAASATSQQPW